MKSRRSRRRAFTLVELMVVIAIIAVLAAILVPNFVRARWQGQMTACISNLKNVATGLEMYSTDNNFRYPSTLSVLVPNYLKAVPSCPSAGADTYTAGYASVSNPDTYTIVCSGNNHPGLGQDVNYPQYSSLSGLISM
jgi:prepilin-type N-terminal cleavage/methylation domain-containing protein